MSQSETSNDVIQQHSTQISVEPEEDQENEYSQENTEVSEKQSGVKGFTKSLRNSLSGNAENAKAWVCVTCLMLITIPVGMPLFGTSLLIEQMKEELQASTAGIGWIVSTAWGLNAAFSPISGAFINKDNTLSAIKVKRLNV